MVPEWWTDHRKRRYRWGIPAPDPIRVLGKRRFALAQKPVKILIAVSIGVNRMCFGPVPRRLMVSAVQWDQRVMNGVAYFALLLRPCRPIPDGDRFISTANRSYEIRNRFKYDINGVVD